MVELVGGGSVINEATRSSFHSTTIMKKRWEQTRAFKYVNIFVNSDLSVEIFPTSAACRKCWLKKNQIHPDAWIFALVSPNEHQLKHICNNRIIGKVVKTGLTCQTQELWAFWWEGLALTFTQLDEHLFKELECFKDVEVRLKLTQLITFFLNKIFSF